MRKRIGALTMMLALAAMVADAQDFREKYEQFKQKATQTYNDFRAKANAKYCEFLKGAWEWYEQMPVVKKPKDETVPPVVLPENDKQKPVTVRPILLDTVVAYRGAAHTSFAHQRCAHCGTIRSPLHILWHTM